MCLWFLTLHRQSSWPFPFFLYTNGKSWVNLVSVDCYTILLLWICSYLLGYLHSMNTFALIATESIATVRINWHDFYQMQFTLVPHPGRDQRRKGNLCYYSHLVIFLLTLLSLEFMQGIHRLFSNVALSIASLVMTMFCFLLHGAQYRIYWHRNDLLWSGAW